MFELYFRPKALRVFQNLERKIQLEVNSTLNDLRLGKFNLYNVRRIEGTKFGYRLRLGRWRILFVLFRKAKKIEIVDIFLKKGKEDYTKRRNLLR